MLQNRVILFLSPRRHRRRRYYIIIIMIIISFSYDKRNQTHAHGAYYYYYYKCASEGLLLSIHFQQHHYGTCPLMFSETKTKLITLR